MKRFGKFILSFAVIVLSAFMFVGCGGSDNKSTIITLSEVKTTIINALAKETLDGPVANRDIFDKFIATKVTAKFVATTGDEVETTTYNHAFEKQDGKYVRYYLAKATNINNAKKDQMNYEYFDEGKYYKYDETLNELTSSAASKDTFKPDNDHYSYITNLFTDEGLLIFDEGVTRTITETGTTLSLTTTVRKLNEFVNGKPYTTDDFKGLPEEVFLSLSNKVTLKVVFDTSNRLQKVILSYVDTQMRSDFAVLKVQNSITIERNFGGLSEPDWIKTEEEE